MEHFIYGAPKLHVVLHDCDQAASNYGSVYLDVNHILQNPKKPTQLTEFQQFQRTIWFLMDTNEVGCAKIRISGDKRKFSHQKSMLR